MRREITPESSQIATLTREVWLKGLPSLASYLSYYESAVQEPLADRPTLAAEWMAANRKYEALAQSEAGLPDTLKSRELAAELAPLVEEVRNDTRFRETFDSAPTRFAWVELDKLMVSQRHIDLGQAERLIERLRNVRNDADLFRFALPLDRKPAPVEVRKHGSGRYVFSSKSADFRFHRATLLRANQLAGYAAFGDVSAALALVVGFGSNFLNVIECEKRMVIHDGHHRAYALRAAGFEYAPCIVQTVTHVEELNVVASAQVAGSPGLYFVSPRPPLLKDFFDADLRKEMLVRKMNRVIEIEYKIREFEAPDVEIVT